MTHINIFLFFLGLIPLNETTQLDSNSLETYQQVEVVEENGVDDSAGTTPSCTNYPKC